MTASHLAAATTLGDFFSHPFLRHAFVAGTLIALAAGLVGYFLVLRAQVFTMDALGHVAFTGALGALAFGVDARLGLFAATVLVAAGMAGLGRGARTDDVAIGSTFAWVLGLGVYFLTLYTTKRSTGNGPASVTYLFGSIFGLSTGAANTAALLAAGVCVVLLVTARPLLFATIDEAVAAARGVPVRALGVGFLVLTGITAAVATQAVGALLILGLVSAPAGTALRLTARPYVALGLSAGLALVAMWLGLFLSYLVPRLPPSFAILSFATAFFLLTALRPASWTTRFTRR